MYSESDYSTALLVYLLAGAGCMLVWWRLTAWIRWRPVRELLRLSVFALIYTPWFAEESAQMRYLPQTVDAQRQVEVQVMAAPGAADARVYLAPAVVIAAFEWLFGDEEAAARAAVPLLLVQALSLLLVLLIAIVRGLRALARREPDLEVA